MVRIHVEVAFAMQLQINNRMLGEQRQHVIEKRHTRADGGFANAVQIDSGNYLRFFGNALDLRVSRFHAAGI